MKRLRDERGRDGSDASPRRRACCARARRWPRTRCAGRACGRGCDGGGAPRARGLGARGGGAAARVQRGGGERDDRQGRTDDPGAPARRRVWPSSRSARGHRHHATPRRRRSGAGAAPAPIARPRRRSARAAPPAPSSPPIAPPRRHGAGDRHDEAGRARASSRRAAARRAGRGRARPDAISDQSRLVADAVRALRHEHDPARAAAILERYLTRYPDGVAAEDALALALEATIGRDPPRAAGFATRYLASYPSGRWSALARRALAP